MNDSTLERRLRDAHRGVASKEVVRHVVTGFALQSVESIYKHFETAKQDLMRLAEAEWLIKQDAAKHDDWNANRTCFASIAWLVEQAFSMRAERETGSGPERALAAVARRATRDILTAFVPPLDNLRISGRRSDDAWYRDFALRAARPDSSLVHGRSVTGICCLSVGQLLSTCQDLAREAGAPNALCDERVRSHDGERVHAYLNDARQRGGPYIEEALHQVIVAPFAALWASGALRVSACETPAPVPLTELERRLDASRRVPPTRHPI